MLGGQKSSTGGAGGSNNDLNDANYDEFNGYSGNLCDNDPYDADDQEADNIYAAIDSRMDERRKESREKLQLKALHDLRKERPQIQQQFVELKRQLSEVSEDQWSEIPEVADWRNKAKRNPRYDRYFLLHDQ